MSRIEGRVAKILTSRELVINKGIDANVDIGMKFAIMAEQAIPIEDPHTGETLEEIPTPKIVLRVVRVYDRVCVASTFRTYSTPGGSMYYLTRRTFDQLNAVPREVTEQIETSSEELGGLPEGFDWSIHVGDRAVQVDEDEFAGWPARPR